MKRRESLVPRQAIVKHVNRWRSVAWMSYGSSLDNRSDRDEFTERFLRENEKNRKESKLKACFESQALQVAGFTVRILETDHYNSYYESHSYTLSVQVPADEWVKGKAFIRGFRAALTSGGMGDAYRLGFTMGRDVLSRLSNPAERPRPVRGIKVAWMKEIAS
ncbi:MAG: hypothetical protein ACRDQZ_19465 [Mycobacteriales bacterium]